MAGPTRFANEPTGFGRLTKWLADRGAAPGRSIVCMEATGVYSEALCYFLDERGYRVAVEDALRIKRGFKTTANKTDPADSRQIAEYAARYEDRLRFWRPNEAIVEQVKTLLSMREQLVRERGAKRNMLHALKRKAVKRKAVQTPAARRLVEEMIAYLGSQIQKVEAAIRRLIRSRPALSEGVTLLMSVPGVGMLLAANLLVVTGGFERKVTARQLAAYIGICPYEHVSGTSVKRRAKSRPYGPPVLRIRPTGAPEAPLSRRAHGEAPYRALRAILPPEARRRQARTARAQQHREQARAYHLRGASRPPAVLRHTPVGQPGAATKHLRKNRPEPLT